MEIWTVGIDFDGCIESELLSSEVRLEELTEELEHWGQTAFAIPMGRWQHRALGVACPIAQV